MRKHTKESLDQLTPQRAVEFLIEGNQRFVSNLTKDHDHLETINETRDGQYPFAVVLSCMDSRTSVELIFDQGLGDLFSIRVAGNIVNDDIIGSIEYAVKYVGSKLLVVLGHTSCGAINSAVNGVQDGHITALLDRIRPSISRAKLKSDSECKHGDKVVYANVENSLQEVISKSPIVNELFTSGQIGLMGAVYNVENGSVDFFKQLTH